MKKNILMVIVCVCIGQLPVYGETIMHFDAALNTIVAGISQGVPLPPDIQKFTNGERFPLVLDISDRNFNRDFIAELQDKEVIIETKYIDWNRLPGIYSAMASFQGIKHLAGRSDIQRVSSGIPIKCLAPLDVSAPEILANQVWYLYGPSSNYLRGHNIPISIADSGVDIYHPSLYKSDPVNHTYSWYDDGNGTIDNNGGDWVDLNSNSIQDAGEVLRFFDGAITDWQSNTTNTDGVYQVNVDWLYNDQNNNSTRDFASGFPETQPSLGEMIFIANDTNSNNVLDTSETIVGLNIPKVLMTYNSDGSTRTRLLDLMQSDLDTIGHGTEVCGVISGGWPGYSLFTGIAPDADLLMYNRMQAAGVTNFLGWSQYNAAEIMLWELGAWVGFYMDGTDWMDVMLNNGHSMGILQVVPAGNLAGASRHSSGTVDPGVPSEYVFAWNPGTVNLQAIYLTIVWNGAGVTTQPTFDIWDQTVSPNQGYYNMPGDSNWYQIGTGPHQFKSMRGSTSSMGTEMFDIEIQSTTPGGYIGTGFFQISVNSAAGNINFPLHAYVADDVTGWSGGVQLGSYGNINVTDSNTVTSPATALQSVTVGSYSTRTDGYGGGTTVGQISDFSGRGPSVTGNLINDISAPGDWDVYSPASLAEPGSTFIGQYREFGGTSAAGPHVAGAAALYIQFDPFNYQGNPTNLKNRLISDAVSDGFTGTVPNNNWGYGKLRVAITPIYTPPTATPTPEMYEGEFGDAPDESYTGVNMWDVYLAKPGMQAAHFPTCYNTQYGMFSMGSWHLDPSLGYLSFGGMIPSLELDVTDTMDPDGMPNLDVLAMIPDFDDDGSPGPPDDGVHFNFFPPSVDVFVNGAPAHINILIDYNQNGTWEITEHIVQDMAVPAGVIQNIPLPAYGMTGEVWVRVTSTVAPMGVYFPLPWDGSIPSPFVNGETEDYLIFVPDEPTITPTAEPTDTPTPTTTANTPTPTPVAIPTTSPVAATILLIVITGLLAFSVSLQRKKK